MNQGQYPPAYPPQGFTPPGAYPAQPAIPAMLAPARRTVRRIGIGSAAKVGAILYALIWTIFGLIFLVFTLCGLTSSLANLSNQNNNGSAGAILGGGIAVVLIFYVIGIIVMAVYGLIAGAIGAALYNLTSRWVGGIEVEVS